ncbi:hypothetical protein Taro_043191 [Colocasia esculenta]|uniref:LYR motif-containing protein 2 n=1 Tax=Colocasia esculenta TaxID=4460 RepID=A0A843WV07_COLES|nr:hypothetical protein [Colocasia esculenta]
MRQWVETPGDISAAALLSARPRREKPAAPARPLQHRRCLPAHWSAPPSGDHAGRPACSPSRANRPHARSTLVLPQPNRSPTLLPDLLVRCSDHLSACRRKPPDLLFDSREDNIMVLSLDLQAFILRARVLSLYRDALRTVRRAPPHARADLIQSIREEMEKNRNCGDKQTVRFLISEGMQRLKGLKEMLDMQGHA